MKDHEWALVQLCPHIQKKKKKSLRHNQLLCSNLLGDENSVLEESSL